MPKKIDGLVRRQNLVERLDKGCAKIGDYLIFALKSISKDFGKSFLPVLQAPQKPPTESILPDLISEISEIPCEFALVLDDYHSIEEVTIQNLMDFMLKYLPAGMHIIISTRVDPHNCRIDSH